MSDRDVLLRQYATSANLSARAGIYAYQRPRVDLPAWVLGHLPAGVRRAGRVLDAGCGGGQYAARLVEAGARPVGLDLSEGMVRAASDVAPGTAGWLIGDAGHLPLRAGSCDAALAMHMLYHLPDPAAGVAELRRVVRPGGTVLILLNGLAHFDTYHELLAEAAESTERLAWPGAQANLGHEPMMQEVFATVALDRLTGTIELADPAPLVAYAQSARDFYEHQIDRPWEEVMARFEAAARRLAARGRLSITTESGVFVCTVSA